MDIKKIAIIIFVLLLTGCSSQKFGADDLTKEEKISVEKVKLDDGKQEYLKYLKDGVQYEKHYYTTTSGESGYQIFINDGETIESIGYGPEAKIRTYKTKFDCRDSLNKNEPICVK